MISKRFEIDVTLNCSLKCNNCDRGCGVAPVNKELSVYDINRFISEANSLQCKFDFVSVLGGEPTLHPNILTILDLLYNNLNFLNNKTVILKTNGYSDKTKKILQNVPKYISIENSLKVNSFPLFSKYNDAPIDYKEFQNSDFTKGCAIAIGCGPSFYPPGKYYCCGAGASVDRIFNLNLGVEHLHELTTEKLIEQKKMYCKYCGHFKDWGVHNMYTREQFISPSWKNAIDNYNKTSK